MAGGFKLSLVPDVGPFVAGMAKAEQSLEDTADALDDLARDAQKQGREAGQDIARGVDDGTDKATKSVESLEASFADMARAGQRASKDTGDDIGRNVKRGTDDAADGLGEFKDEANSTAKETAASFDGSADSIAGAFQEVAANALGGFGPIGAAAGLALAAGLGTFWSNFQADAERAKQATADAFEDMIASGKKFLSEELISKRIQDIIMGNEDAATSYENVKDVARRSGADISLVLAAFAGDQDSINALLDTSRSKIQEIRDAYGVTGAAIAGEDRGRITKLGEIINGLEDVQRTTESAATSADVYGEAVRLAGDKAVDSAARARAEYDGLGRKLDDVAVERTVTVKVTADTTNAERAIKRFTDGSYAVTVNGRVTGMRMV